MEMSPQLTAKFEQLQNAYPVKRSALIPMMMCAQDELGCVSDEMIAEIAERLELHTVQVEETLAYYSMLHRKPMGKHHVQVCTNVACMLCGGNEILDLAKKRLEIGNKEVTQDGVFSLEEVECIGACTGAPAMQVNYDFYENLTPLKFDRIIEELDKGKYPTPEAVISGALHERRTGETPLISKRWGIKDSQRIEVYKRNQGYQALGKALREMTPESIIDEVKKSGLRGRGGAGFPTGMKWSFLAKPEGVPRYLVCNADESEPGTFKDRYLMEFLPHLLIEGLIVSSYALGSKRTYIYIRGEYAWIPDILEQAIDEAKAAGWLGTNILSTGYELEIYVHRGAGAYICGEETALLESLEGKRGNPRIKPPFPAIKGLWDSPTVVNNVETLAAVVPILNIGGEEYAKIGLGKSTGTKLLSACGNINKPGVYEIDMTISVEEFIYSDEYCGGIPNGKRLKACIPGGSSVPILPANLLLKTAKGETRLMNYECLSDGGFPKGSMMGSGGFIVLDEDQCVVRHTLTLARFYRHESCGQCSPCREGTGWMEKILKNIEYGKGKSSDIDLLWDIQRKIEGNTICPLGDAAAWPVAAAIRHFRDEFEWHVNNPVECLTRNYGLAHYADPLEAAAPA